MMVQASAKRSGRAVLRALALLVTLGSLAGSSEAEAKQAPGLSPREIPLPGLDLSGETTVRAASVMIDPAGRGLLVTTFQDAQLFLLPWDGPPQRLQEIEGAGGNLGPILRISADDEHVLVLHRGSWATSVHEPGGRLVETLPRHASSVDGLLLTGQPARERSALAIGAPIVAQGDETPRWDDRSWRRSRLRDDCRLYSVQLGKAPLIHVPRLCRPELETPTGRILRGGHLVPSADGSRVFAVLEALPSLFLLKPSGEILREVATLEPGEAGPALTEADERAQTASHRAPLELRSSFPWCLGILRWKGSLGLVYRLWDAAEERARFVADLYDLEGEKLADDVDLGLPSGDFWTLVRPLNGPDGRAYLLRTERSGFSGSEIRSQVLYQVPAPALAATGAEAPATRPAGLTFRLLDEETAEPVLHARLMVETGSKTVLEESDGPDGLHVVPLPTSAPAGPSRITLDADGYLSTSFEADLAGHADLGTILLSPGVIVRGLVLDAQTGAPLPGARVSSVRRHPWGALAAAHLGYVNAATTDAEGRFRLSGFEEGGGCLSVAAPGQVEQAVPLGVLEEGESRDLGTVYVGQAARVTGRAVDGDGEPFESRAPGTVGAVSAELRAGPLRAPCLRLEQPVGEAGAFDFPAVPPGRYWLALLQDHRILATERVEVEGGSPLDVGEVVARLRTFQGRLSLGGVPLGGASVTLSEGGAGEPLPAPVFLASSQGGRQTLVSDLGSTLGTSTDPEGRFAVRGYLPPGEAWLTATLNDGTTLRHPFQLQGLFQPVDLDVDFRGPPLRGVVLDERGAPAPGVTVSLLDGDDVLRVAASAADGTFELPAAPPGSHVLEAKAQEGLARQLYDPEKGSALPELRLQAAEAARLVVAPPLDDSGAPLRTAAFVTDGRRTHLLRTLQGPTAFPGLPPGRYQVVAYAGGVLTASPPVDLTAGQQQEVHLEATDATPEPVQLGEDLAGLPVRLLTSDRFSASPLLNHLGRTLEVGLDGQVDLPALGPGRWLVTFQGQPKPREGGFVVQAGLTVVDTR